MTKAVYITSYRNSKSALNISTVSCVVLDEAMLPDEAKELILKIKFDKIKVRCSRINTLLDNYGSFFKYKTDLVKFKTGLAQRKAVRIKAQLLCLPYLLKCKINGENLNLYQTFDVPKSSYLDSITIKNYTSTYGLKLAMIFAIHYYTKQIRWVYTLYNKYTRKHKFRKVPLHYNDIIKYGITPYHITKNLEQTLVKYSVDQILKGTPIGREIGTFLYQLPKWWLIFNGYKQIGLFDYIKDPILKTALKRANYENSLSYLKK